MPEQRPWQRDARSCSVWVPCPTGDGWSSPGSPGSPWRRDAEDYCPAGARTHGGSLSQVFTEQAAWPNVPGRERSAANPWILPLQRPSATLRFPSAVPAGPSLSLPVPPGPSRSLPVPPDPRRSLPVPPGRDSSASRRLCRGSRRARSCYQGHKRKEALLTFPYVTQSNSSMCEFFVLLGRRECRWA